MAAMRSVTGGAGGGVASGMSAAAAAAHLMIPAAAAAAAAAGGGQGYQYAAALGTSPLLTQDSTAIGFQVRHRSIL